MRRLAAPMLIVGLLVIAGLSAWPVTAQTSACQIAPVFLMLRDLIGKDRIGECTSAVLRSDSGDFNQPTTRGMLTFRPSDLIVAFSDGQTTWLYGPNGLESRPIGTRLSWEGTGAPLAAAGTGTGTGIGTGAVSPSLSAGVPAQQAPLPTPTPAVMNTLPIRVDGDESATTKPFELPGGDYAIDWQIERQRGKTSCYVGGRLRRYDDPNPGALVLHTTLNTSNDRTASGEARVFSVLPGRCVLDVDTTGCDWRFTIKLPS